MTIVVSNEIKNLFEVPLMISEVFLPHELIATDVIKHCDSLNHYTTFHHEQATEEWFSRMPAKKYFIEAVENLVHQYLEVTGRKEARRGIRIRAWGSVWREGQVHMSHMHPHCIIAGTYYPQADDSSAPITFECPWDGYCMADTIDIKRLEYKHQPQTGDLLMWPAWLRHRVGVQREPKRVTRPRVAISFNINYDRLWT
jgi:uncharacterized protein (TIGR02466 family)